MDITSDKYFNYSSEANLRFVYKKSNFKSLKETAKKTVCKLLYYRMLVLIINKSQRFLFIQYKTGFGFKTPFEFGH